MCARDVMSAPVHTVRLDDNLWDTWALMSRSDVRHVVVIDGHGRVAGIVDDRQVFHAWPNGPLAAQRTTVGSLVHPRVRTVTGGTALYRVARAMLANDVDAVPVVSSNGTVVGLVTATDLIVHLARLGETSGDLPTKRQ